MTDRELIRRIQNGNRDALGSLIERYYDDVYRFCLYLTANETDACDISQEVFFRFIRHADCYQYKNLKGYLLITARNLCRDYLRKKEREKRVELPEDMLCEKKTLDELETTLFINEILQQVPLEQRGHSFKNPGGTEVSGNCGHAGMQPVHGKIPIPAGNREAEKGDERR